MGGRTKKILVVGFIALVFIVTVSMYFLFNNRKDLAFRSGTLFYKVNILNEDSARIYKWDVGISKNNIKNSVNQSESNREALDKFRKTINEISVEKFSLFLLILYLIFVLIVFVTVEKDNQIYKSKNDKKLFRLVIIMLMIFLIYKIINCSIELNGLHKDIIYYFNIIS